jgi:ankyrin repeat protein
MRMNAPRLAGLLAVLSLAVATATTGDLPLTKAVKSHDLNAVRALLKQGVDVNAHQADGATALHWAAYLDDLEATDLLLRAKAVADTTNELGVTPLYLACENGGAAVVERLLAGGASANATLPSGETALMTAARSGNVRSVKALIAKGAKLEAVESTEGQNALMWAVSYKHPNVVQALIEAGADVRAKSKIRPVMRSRGGRGEGGKAVLNEGGFSPLLFAARVGDLASARLLVAAGADPNEVAPLGTSVLLVAAQSGHEDVAEFLLDRGADPNAAAAGFGALHIAILRGHFDLVQKLIAHHVDVNAPVTNGTPVVRQGKEFTIAATLVGATPFFLAAKLADARTMRVLADAGANPLTGLKDGTTPLMVAAGVRTGGLGRGGTDRLDREMDSAEVQFALTQDPDSRAFIGSGLDAVKLAYELGGDVNAVNDAGDTALHYAAFHGFKSVIQFLVDKGANINARNKRGQSPLMMAMGEDAPAKMTPDLGNPNERSTELLLRKLGAKDYEAEAVSPRRDEERPAVEIPAPGPQK